MFEQRELSRGGLLIRLDRPEGVFRLQIGAYPETIKDTLDSPEGVPDLYLLPDLLFDGEAGITAAELEFPLYYNYYLKNRKLRFICRPSQLRRILTVLRESLFGPRRLSLEREFPDGADTPGFPDLAREFSYFKGDLRLKHVLAPVLFDDHHQVEVDGVCIRDLGHGRYRFEADGRSREVEFEYLSARESAAAPWEEAQFTPPVFGITVIGSGHGFDASTSTSGFILWFDRKGVMVDPPVNTTAWLRANGIHTRLISDLILTHCHADHDSGTLQKLLEEGRLRLHTTETVLESFLLKYSALTGLNQSELRSLFSFRPVLIGSSIKVGGGDFLFHYNFHPIPTLGFSCSYQGKSFAYSCDTLYDPTLLRRLRQEGYFSDERLDRLLEFPWNSDVVFHEAGLAPIHTPIAVLSELPEEVKSRLYLMHVSRQSVPPGSGLKVAPCGGGQTLTLKVPPPETGLAQRMLDVLAHLDLFRDMPLERAHEFLQITRYCQVEAGHVIFRKGTMGDRFYMVMSGEVEVAPDSENRFLFGRYDYFGERALITREPRSADLVARTPVELLWIDRADFLAFIRDTRLTRLFRRLDENRCRGSWSLFEHNRVLRHLTTLQKNQLTLLMKHQDVAAGSWLFRPEDPISHYFLVDQGRIRVTSPGGHSLLVRRGGLVGEPTRKLEPGFHQFWARAAEDSAVYRIGLRELADFCRENPGTQVRLLDLIRSVHRPRTLAATATS